MKYDNLQLVDMDADGDLDILTTEEGEGIFTVGTEKAGFVGYHDITYWSKRPRPDL